MCDDAVSRLVIERVNSERATAKNISSQIARSGAGMSIRDFFPELATTINGGRWGSWPRSVLLPHFLLIGPAPVVDLRPMDSTEFQRLHRFTITQVAELAHQGLLILNLHVRDPKEWKGFSDFVPLIKKSFVNGERVDAFYRARNPQYDTFVNDRCKEIRPYLTPENMRFLSTRERDTELDKAATALGTRWAYLDILNTRAAETVQYMFETGQPQQAIEYLRATKHLVGSPISAALGGECCWGSEHVELVTRVSDTGPVRPSYGGNTECLEYMTAQLAGVRPFEIFKEYNVMQLIAFLTNPNFSEKKAALSDAQEAMAEMLARGEARSGTVDEFAAAAKETRQRILEYEKKIGFAAKAGVTLGLGLLVSWQAGVVIGLAGELVKLTIGDYAPKFGSAVHRLFDPRRHRLVCSLDKLRSLRNE